MGGEYPSVDGRLAKHNTYGKGGLFAYICSLPVEECLALNISLNLLSLSIHPFIHPSIRPFDVRPSLCLSVCSPVRPSVQSIFVSLYGCICLGPEYPPLTFKLFLFGVRCASQDRPLAGLN